MTRRWDPAVSHRGPEAETFVREFFGGRRVVAVAGAGFDPRARIVLELVAAAGAELKGILIRETRPDPPGGEVALAEENQGALEQASAGLTTVEVAIFDTDGAVVGQACFKPGMIKSTYGTGCFALMNTGAKAVLSKNRLLTTVGYRLKGELAYASEGSIFIAGAAVQWLRDGLKLIHQAGETEALARRLNQGRTLMDEIPMDMARTDSNYDEDDADRHLGDRAE